MIMRLGQLGIEVEKYCRSHRDIEWGFWNNNLYLFQSRPVTSGMNETIFEIDHEFDCPLRVEKDFSSTCNIGEVMPGAITPFGLEYMAKMFSIAMHAEKTAWVPPVYSRYFFLGWMMAYNHAMFLVTDMFRGQKPGDLHYFAQATMLAFFGRIIDDEEIFQICEDRYGDTKPEFSLLSLLRVLWINQKRLQKEQKAYAKYRIQVEKFKTSKELFDHLLQNCCSVLNAYSPNMLTSQASMVWNLFVFTILGKARRGFSNEVYSDLAYLLKTSCDVESADVPSAMQSLAFQISEAINVDEFKHMSVEEALHWLQNTPSAAGKKFREFLEKHGHRCLKEFDVYSIPWASDPKPLVKLLQNMAGNVSKDFTKAGSKNFNEILSNLSLSLGFFSRSMLKFLLPLSHRAVRNREASKSLMVKGFNEWRKAFRHLAKLMVSEGRIPEEDLLFFMTIDEVKELLNTRSPKIIARATQRLRRHPVINKYIFPEIMKGIPKPVNLIDEPIIPTSEDFMMTGVPVSQGVAEGAVRVALTLEEASYLKPGEILLTYGTDIGWTPYFPMLAGVVTELGGLISHGAVVSREYGIPCIAGLHEVTRNFQTGDYVRLDGYKGILQKIPRPENT